MIASQGFLFLSRTIWTTILLFTVISQEWRVEAVRKVWRRVEAISGREAVLPCELGPMNENSDMIYVVLWYLNGRKEPIYSYDNRPRALQTGDDRHSIQSDTLDGRVYFSIGSNPSLHVKPVKTEDQANYTCRVDFRVANSRTTHLSLYVVVPPSLPTLRLDGRNLYGSDLGPLLEGQTLRVSCLVRGGEPPPDVVWVKDSTDILDDEIESQNLLQTVNVLTIPRLPRAFHNSQLTCKAFNNNVTIPASTTVQVKMNLRPLKVALRNPPKQMKIGTTYEVTCLSSGSKPSPNITWTLGNIASVIAVPSTTEETLNSTVSVATLTATRNFHGQRLACSVVNKLFPTFVLSDSILLNITYPPVVALELGRGVSSVVKEGEDVYFNCMVDSNPPTYKTRWFHESTLLHHSPEDGVLIGGHSLALRGITRHQAGKYACEASNVQGDARSPPIYLKVNYAPVCSLGVPHSKILASAIGQNLSISCDVIAEPSDVKYSWVFNNSITSERLKGNQVVMVPGGQSVVHFAARKQQDYGTFQCWAENEVGQMKNPCLYHVLPAGPPDPPENCSVANKTYDSLIILCHPGFDGGLKPTFIARVYESVTQLSQQNRSSDQPKFVLKGLTPGIDYIIRVSAKNQLGHSSSKRLEAFTYKMAENRMRNEKRGEISGMSREDSTVLASSPAEGSKGVAIALLGGILLLLAAIAVLILLIKGVVLRRTLQRSQNDSFSQSKDLKRTESLAEMNCPLQTRTQINAEDQSTFEVQTVALKQADMKYSLGDHPL